MGSLTERQIQRYSRQILLQGVGGKGQQLLGSRAVLVAEGGPTLSAAAAYLLAGGTPLLLGPQVALEGFLGGVALEDFNPDAKAEAGAWLLLGEVTSDVELPAEVVVRGGSLAARGPGGCRACFRATLEALPAGSVEDPVTWGALAALVCQRLLLGQSESLLALHLIEGIPRPVEPARCRVHG